MDKGILSPVQQRTVWIGDLDKWMDEAFIKERLTYYKIPFKDVRVIRDKSCNVSLGYGFIEFLSKNQAEEVINLYSNKALLDKDKTFKLNWAVDSESKKIANGTQLGLFNIYISGFPEETTEYELENYFRKYYKYINSVKIITEPSTGISKGYGFVKFTNEKEMKDALKNMNGKSFKGEILKTK
jgi:RNA recognition motif-containing protein